MATIVSRNTIQLASGASSTANAYKGHTLILKRYNAVTGKEMVQRKTIASYDGSTKIATIDGIWDADFIPAVTDTYQIVPAYPDSRVSINPAIQTLDYVTSTRYGKGLDPVKDLYLASWLQSARYCDVQSDVTVHVLGSTSGYVVGAVYKWESGGELKFQGEVASKTATHVTFTKVIGKLTNKWNSWKNYKTGDLVYDVDNKLYRVQSNGTLPQPPISSGSRVLHLEAFGLTKVSGAGNAAMQLQVNGNPVRSVNAAGNTISGYSLYDGDGIDYWRLLGWDEHSQRYVTRHQANLVIDTSVSQFDNINSLLEHFNGMLSYIGGKYHLNVEIGEGEIPSTDERDPRNITMDHVIGRIRLTDDGIRSAANSLTVAYPDPANKFEAKNIAFFNSEFLKADRNVPKKSSITIPGITNYYNARLLAEKQLIKSRFNLSISLQMAPRGALLLPGRVIQVTQPKYGWINKKFRIENITHNTDTTVDLVAKEYDDTFYIVKSISRMPAAAQSGDPATRPSVQPGGLRASSMDSEDEKVGGILLAWDPLPAPDPTVYTEIYGSEYDFLQVTVTVAANGTVTLTGPSALPDTIKLKFFSAPEVSTTPMVGAEFNFTKIPAGGWLIKNPENITVHLASGTYTFLTADLIDTVASSVTTYIDTVQFPDVPVSLTPGEVPAEGDDYEPTPLPERDDRITKFYWIRHKIIQQ